ncbi:MAG: hypothetical protein GY880_05840 [Planctomycetaceae bacterium]|nr:hypothetical protein [Planctomycetaceae bacterium]
MNPQKRVWARVESRSSESPEEYGPVHGLGEIAALGSNTANTFSKTPKSIDKTPIDNSNLNQVHSLPTSHTMIKRNVNETLIHRVGWSGSSVGRAMD